MSKLDGKRILVTGGTTGIGRAIAIDLARNGAHVLIIGRHQKELDDALEAMTNVVGDVKGIIADQAKPQDVAKVFARASELGELDAAIVNAGLAAEGLADEPDEKWRYVVETNLLGYLDVAKRAGEAFGDGEGDIILVGSVSADNRTKGTSVYTATKAGIQGFADAFRKEMGDKGVRVSLVEPGAVGSDMQESSPEEQREKIAQGKMLKAEDIAELVTFILTRPRRCTMSLARMEERVHAS